MPSHTKYAPPSHFMITNRPTHVVSRAPMPNIESPIINPKPRDPPAIVARVRLVPCSAPWVRAKSPFGPGVSDSPIAARA
jgi:hypothetical protein